MVQVKSVWLALEPNEEPIVKHVGVALFGSWIFQLIRSLGAVAPVGPVTVAVKVMVPPKSGVGALTEMSGVAFVTDTERDPEL